MLDLIYVILWQSECEDADQAERAAIKFHPWKTVTWDDWAGAGDVTGYV